MRRSSSLLILALLLTTGLMAQAPAGPAATPGASTAPARPPAADMARLADGGRRHREGHRRQADSRRRAARRARRPGAVPEGVRHAFACPPGRADDARHGVRHGVGDEGGGDHDERDDARRGREDQAERPRGDLHPRLRPSRQGRHHDPPPADARLRAPARPGSERRLVAELRGGDPARVRGSAHVGAGRAPCVQRHQLLPPRRDRLACGGDAVRTVRAGAACGAAGHARHDVQPAGVAQAENRADGNVHALRLALRGPQPGHAARHRPRPDGPPHGGRGRPRRLVQHRGRPRALLPHGARRRRPRHDAHPVAPHRDQDDVSGHAGRHGERARARVGPRLQLFVEPRRAVPGGLVRPHGVDGHVGVDGPHHADLRHPALQPRTPGRQGRRGTGAGPGGDHRRFRAPTTPG